ncbi:MAG: hypothetical protein OQK82_06705, partial [Candidatus Pacearchaeota archaeon]|nr:hypothetical protein [Candidatus Pacearchaeota archaeon]
LIIFPRYDKVILSRPDKFGGEIVFANYKDLEKAFSKKQVHPLDLKNVCTKYLSEVCGDIRKKFVAKK